MRSKIIFVSTVVIFVFILISYWSSKSVLQPKSNISGTFPKKKTGFQGLKRKSNAPNITPKEDQTARDPQVKENLNTPDMSSRERQGAREQKDKGTPDALDIGVAERQGATDKQIKGTSNAPDTRPRQRQTPSEKQVEDELNSLHMTPEERQTVRKQHLEEYCSKHAYNKSLGTKDVQMLAVDDDLKLIYCVVPKVGTTTWKRVIAKSREIQPGINRWIMWKRLSNYTEEERNQRLKTYLKFVFVREPLQRLLSAYKNKFLQIPSYTKDLRKEIVQSLRPQDFKPEGKNFIKFKEFIQYFSNNMSRNQHWRQYEKLCHPCVIDYDFIGHLETLKEDAALLLKMAGIDSRVTFPPIHKSTGPSEVLKYYSRVPLKYINRLGEQYRNDFGMFGYEYLGPVKKLLKQYSKD